VIGEDEPILICLKASKALVSDLRSGSLRKIRCIHKLESISLHTMVNVLKGEEKVV
jgi:hypothetical protein